MAFNKTDVTLEIRISQHIMAGLQALADRDPELTVATVIRRALMRELGLADTAIAVWELEAAIANAPVYLTPGAAALIAKTLELTPEELEELNALKEDVDELKDIMKKVDKKFGEVT